MKTTNRLLGVIAFLLFLHLLQNSSLNLFATATAQPSTKTKQEVINVRIVEISDQAVMNIKANKAKDGTPLPVIVLNSLSSNEFPNSTPPVQVVQVNK